MKKYVSVFIATLTCVASVEAATTETSDFIKAPEYFNGFEGMPSPSSTFGRTYTEDNITVTQVNGQRKDIWNTWLDWGAEGNYSWYPNGGDQGYTALTLADGQEFTSVSFLWAGGVGYFVDGVQVAPNFSYELVLDDQVVQAGTLAGLGSPRLGFAGGGFDEVRLKVVAPFSTAPFHSGEGNSLAIDSIKVMTSAVPEPTTYALMLLGAAAVGFVARRKG